jgi:sodium-dependent dicarboxylate transporter 2/3/5
MIEPRLPSPPVDSLEDAGARPRWAPMALAVGLALLLYTFPLPGLSEEGRRLAAVLAIVVTLWLAEVVPLSITALIGPALAVLLGVAPAERAFAAFGNPIVMLFVGSFLLARATFKHHLNERIAYRVLSLAVLRNDPTRAFVFLGLTTAGLSAWMSNTATCAMMLPIAQSVLAAMTSGRHRAAPQAYAAALMLIVAYSASLGGLFTPIGTPPNLIGLGLIEQATGVRVSFGAWVVRVFPIACLCLLLMMAYMARSFRKELQALVYQRSEMVARYAALGQWRPVEKRVVAALLTTLVLWLLPSLMVLADPAIATFVASRLAEAAVPVLVAGTLFVMKTGDRSSPPILEVADLAAVDWPVIILFGGGMCLGALMIETGLARVLGETLAGYLPANNGLVVVFAFTLLAIAVSETTSNTASANMAIPVVMAVATRVGGDPVALGLAATAACTFGFMLPVSTPTNAMAYATGHVTQRQMLRSGLALDVGGAVLLTLWFGLLW